MRTFIPIDDRLGRFLTRPEKKTTSVQWSLIVILLTCHIFSGLNAYAQTGTTLSTAPSPFGTSLPSNNLLSADEAFKLSAIIELPATIVLMWEIQDGYYLYEKSLDVLETNGSLTSPPNIPEGIVIEDEFFGEVEVFYNRLLLRLAFENNNQTSSSPFNSSETITMQLSYQGCAEVGFCYPMQHKQIVLALP